MDLTVAALNRGQHPGTRSQPSDGQEIRTFIFNEIVGLTKSSICKSFLFNNIVGVIETSYLRRVGASDAPRHLGRSFVFINFLGYTFNLPSFFSCSPQVLPAWASG